MLYDNWNITGLIASESMKSLLQGSQYNTIIYKYAVPVYTYEVIPTPGLSSMTAIPCWSHWSMISSA